jgi:hypothetical protein
LPLSVHTINIALKAIERFRPEPGDIRKDNVDLDPYSDDFLQLIIGAKNELRQEMPLAMERAQAAQDGARALREESERQAKEKPPVARKAATAAKAVKKATPAKRTNAKKKPEPEET